MEELCRSHRIQTLINDLICISPDSVVSNMKAEDPAKLKFLMDPLWWNGLKSSLREIQWLATETVPKDRFEALQIEHQLLLTENMEGRLRSCSIKDEISSLIISMEETVRQRFSAIFSKVLQLEHMIQCFYHIRGRCLQTCRNSEQNRIISTSPVLPYPQKLMLLWTEPNSIEEMIPKSRYDALSNELCQKEIELDKLRSFVMDSVSRAQFNSAVLELDRISHENETLRQKISCQTSERQDEIAHCQNEIAALKANLQMLITQQSGSGSVDCASAQHVIEDLDTFHRSILIHLEQSISHAEAIERALEQIHRVYPDVIATLISKVDSDQQIGVYAPPLRNACRSPGPAAHPTGTSADLTLDSDADSAAEAPAGRYAGASASEASEVLNSHSTAGHATQSGIRDRGGWCMSDTLRRMAVERGQWTSEGRRQELRMARDCVGFLSRELDHLDAFARATAARATVAARREELGRREVASRLRALEVRCRLAEAEGARARAECARARAEADAMRDLLEAGRRRQPGAAIADDPPSQPVAHASFDCHGSSESPGVAGSASHCEPGLSGPGDSGGVPWPVHQAVVAELQVARAAGRRLGRQARRLVPRRQLDMALSGLEARAREVDDALRRLGAGLSPRTG